jgi:pyruvate carboxylase
VRLDAGNAFTGAHITPHYDSLLVKISTWGLTLKESARVMDRSLQEFRIRGVKTNIPFWRMWLRHPTFLAGNCDTSFIDKHPELLTRREKKDRATKILSFLGDVIVNGSPGIDKPLRSLELLEPKVPEIDRAAALGKGTPTYSANRAPKGCPAGSWSRSSSSSPTPPCAMRTSRSWRPACGPTTSCGLPKPPRTWVPGSSPWRCGAAPPSTWPCASSRNDPWQRLHKLREAIPNTLFQMLLRGSNAVGYTNYPDNVVERFVEEGAASGIDVFRVFDSLNWTTGMTVAMDAVSKQEARSARRRSATPATSPTRSATSTRSTTT